MAERFQQCHLLPCKHSSPPALWFPSKKRSVAFFCFSFPNRNTSFANLNDWLIKTNTMWWNVYLDKCENVGQGRVCGVRGQKLTFRCRAIGQRWAWCGVSVGRTDWHPNTVILAVRVPLRRGSLVERRGLVVALRMRWPKFHQSVWFRFLHCPRILARLVIRDQKPRDQMQLHRRDAGRSIVSHKWSMQVENGSNHTADQWLAPPSITTTKPKCETLFSFFSLFQFTFTPTLERNLRFTLTFVWRSNYLYESECVCVCEESIPKLFQERQVVREMRVGGAIPEAPPPSVDTSQWWNTIECYINIFPLARFELFLNSSLKYLQGGSTADFELIRLFDFRGDFSPLYKVPGVKKGKVCVCVGGFC